MPPQDSSGEDNGQVTIIGGSKLFHGAPILSLKAASRIVDMVFFASPEPSIGEVANHLKSQLSSFIWVPWEDVESYISKSDSVLMGPGFMRYSTESQTSKSRESCDAECQRTREITRMFLEKFPDIKWVIDAGSLQTMEADWIPKDAIITPNKHEFEMLFGDMKPQKAAKKYSCTIVYKGPETVVTNGDDVVLIRGGNAGLTKGGTGDTLAGLTVALLAKNDPLLAASAATFILKRTAEDLEEKVGTNFNADDVADSVFLTMQKYLQNS